MRGQSGVLMGLATAAIAFVLIMAFLFVGARIGAEFQNQTNATLYPAASNVLTQGLTALQSLAQWQNIIAIVVAASILIGILVSSFGFGGRGRGR